MTIVGRKPIEVAVWLAAIGFLGWVLPSIMGVVYTDPLLHLTYAGLTVLFAAMVVVERVYVDDKNVWTHMLAGVRFAMLSFLLLMAVDTIRANRASGGQMWPDAGHVVRVTAIAFAFAVFGSGLSAALAARVTRAATAKQILRTGFLLTLAALIYGSRHFAGLDFLLMQMVQPGGGWGMLTMACGALIASGFGLGRMAGR
jgi:hypothetical protein